jgi:hypothetical protein
MGSFRTSSEADRSGFFSQNCGNLSGRTAGGGLKQRFRKKFTKLLKSLLHSFGGHGIMSALPVRSKGKLSSSNARYRRQFSSQYPRSGDGMMSIHASFDSAAFESVSGEIDHASRCTQRSGHLGRGRRSIGIGT